ncbi:MAG: RNA-binding protein [Phycisphaerae bacterium]|nr:RNA-binding protein [Phycisphaerae bacterium]
MANKAIFNSTPGAMLPKANTRNEAGGSAYKLSPQHSLAQYAATGCINGTFYATADEQLERILNLAGQVAPEFVARVALYTRSKAHMKDTPALLVAALSVLSPGLMAEVFDRVIDNAKMLRNFVQIMRSGMVARKSLGSLPKRMVQQWIERRSDDELFRASVGSAPSLADIIRMVHPKPATAARAALFAYLIGKPHDAAALPELVRQFEAFKSDPSQFGESALPAVPMDMLTSLKLTDGHWKALARKANWQSLRMNLNTFARHRVFDDAGCVREAASKLRDPKAIAAARVFPYQLLAAYANVGETMSPRIKEALQDAMEIAIGNVPKIDGKVWVFPDVSGSMHSPVTGSRKGSTSKVRCIDVAALMAAAVLRKNPTAEVLPFSDKVVMPDLNPRDSVMTNARRLASLPSGGTNCSAPLAHLNQKGLDGDLLIYVSDNESWVDNAGRGQSTRTMAEWQLFKRRNPKARMVCIDVQPYGTVQAPDRSDILNIGGFADAVFTVISEFNDNTLNPEHWVGVIEKETI